MSRRKKPRVHLDKIPPEVQQGEPVGLDVEGFGMKKARLHRPTGKFASLQVCVGDDVYIIRDVKKVQPALKQVRRGQWAFQHAEFDLRHLRNWTGKQRYLEPSPKHFWDTMLIEQLLYGGYYSFERATGAALSDMARRYFNILLDKGVREEFATATELTPETIEYGAMDAWITRRIMERQQEVLVGHPVEADFNRLWEDIEAPMVYVLLDWNGVLVNEERWRELAQGHYEDMQRIREEAGFNPGSNSQTKARLHAEGHKVRNVQASTLEPLQDVSHTARIRIAYKRAEKLYGTYGIRWANNYIEDDGRVYTDYHQIGTVTGRFASSKPNLQNIPVRRTLDYRRCFIAPKGSVLIVLDFEQQEPRITAYRSQDKNLLMALKRGKDVHLQVARDVYKDPTIKGDDPRRHYGKGVNLGLVYGLTPIGLAERTGLSEYEAELLIREYFNTYPDVKNMITRDQAFAEQNWYIRTVGGRVVHINCYYRQWHNLAANYPIQGSGADMLKRTMVLLRQLCEIKDVPLPLVLQVHDELVLEVPRKETTFYKKLVREAGKQAAFELCPGLKFPVEMHVGKTWACAKEKKGG